jgi:hypothetical protein
MRLPGFRRPTRILANAATCQLKIDGALAGHDPTLRATGRRGGAEALAGPEEKKVTAVGRWRGQCGPGVVATTGGQYDPGKETVMIELTEQQRQELSVPEPVVIDPQTRNEYVLVRREVYARMRAIFDEEGPDMRAIGVLVDQAMREEDEGDPTLVFYQAKYGRKP